MIKIRSFFFILLIPIILQSCEKNNVVHSQFDSIIPDIPVHPQGWSIQLLDESITSTILNYPRPITTFLPGSGDSFLASSLNTVTRETGIVFRHLSPMWRDLESTQLVTRLARGEHIKILRIEPWAFDRIGPSRAYYVEDAFGNRGYIANDSVFFPTSYLSNVTLGVVETIRYSASLDPPLLNARATGQPVEVMVFHYPDHTYALVPDFYLPTSGTLTHEGSLKVSSVMPGSTGFPELGIVLTNPLSQHSTLLTMAHLALLDSGPRVTTQYTVRIQGSITSLANPLLSVGLQTWNSIFNSIPISERGLIFEFAGTRHNEVFVRFYGFRPGVRGYEKSFSHEITYSKEIPFRVKEQNTALRLSSQQSGGLIERLPVGTLVYPIRISVPSDMIMQERQFWVQVYPRETGTSPGWLWGKYIAP